MYPASLCDGVSGPFERMDPPVDRAVKGGGGGEGEEALIPAAATAEWSESLAWRTVSRVWIKAVNRYTSPRISFCFD